MILDKKDEGLEPGIRFGGRRTDGAVRNRATSRSVEGGAAFHSRSTSVLMSIPFNINISIYSSKMMSLDISTIPTWSITNSLP